MFQFQTRVFFIQLWDVFLGNGESSKNLCSTGNQIKCISQKCPNKNDENVISLLAALAKGGLSIAPGMATITYPPPKEGTPWNGLGRFNLQYRKEGVEESTEGDEDAPVAPARMRLRLTRLACGKSP